MNHYSFDYPTLGKSTLLLSKSALVVRVVQGQEVTRKMPWNGLHAHAMNGKSNEIKEEILMEGTICRERFDCTLSFMTTD